MESFPVLGAQILSDRAVYLHQGGTHGAEAELRSPQPVSTMNVDLESPPLQGFSV